MLTKDGKFIPLYFERLIMKRLLVTGFLFIIFALGGFAQDTLDWDIVKVLRRYEKSFGGVVHSDGLGMGYRYGKHLTGYKKRMFEGEFMTMKHPKQIRSYREFTNSKSFIYGKLNNFALIRANTGIHKVIYSKPNWGGVEVRYFYYGGAALGFLKPIYLNVIKETSQQGIYELAVEKYDPDVHDLDNIYGRASFLNGINEIKLVAGGHAKVGFNFEYGIEDERTKILEIGMSLDAFPQPVPLMAFNSKKHLFLTFYFSFQWGKRFNKF